MAAKWGAVGGSVLLVDPGLLVLVGEKRRSAGCLNAKWLLVQRRLMEGDGSARPLRRPDLLRMRTHTHWLRGECLASQLVIRDSCDSHITRCFRHAARAMPASGRAANRVASCNTRSLITPTAAR